MQGEAARLSSPRIIASLAGLPGELVFNYLLLINIAGFLMMGFDKLQAAKGGWRTPEKTFFTISLIGGVFGVISGMFAFRHKTRKASFQLPIFLILILCFNPHPPESLDIAEENF